MEFKPYSALTILPSTANVEVPIREYFAGVKQILFVGRRSDYETIINAFDREFRKHNIQPEGNDLVISYEHGLKCGNVLTRTFNLEIYLLEQLNSICPEVHRIEDGRLSANDLSILEKLSTVSSLMFNSTVSNMHLQTKISW